MNRDETAALVVLESLLLLLIDKGMLRTDEVIHAIEDAVEALHSTSDQEVAPLLRKILRSVTAVHAGHS